MRYYAFVIKVNREPFRSAIDAARDVLAEHGFVLYKVKVRGNTLVLYTYRPYSLFAIPPVALAFVGGAVAAVLGGILLKVIKGKKGLPSPEKPEEGITLKDVLTWGVILASAWFVSNALRKVVA